MIMLRCISIIIIISCVFCFINLESLLLASCLHGISFISVYCHSTLLPNQIRKVVSNVGMSTRLKYHNHNQNTNIFTVLHNLSNGLMKQVSGMLTTEFSFQIVRVPFKTSGINCRVMYINLKYVASPLPFSDQLITHCTFILLGHAEPDGQFGT